MSASVGRKGAFAMPVAVSVILGTVAVAAVVWLAYLALTSDSVPLVGTARGALIVIAIVGMAACGIAGIGQAPMVGWAHPITILGILIGLVAFALIGAGLFGWDGLVRPFAGIVPMGAAVAATTERLAIGLLAALIAVKWLIGIPFALLANR